ncbi:MAG: hypothetical protein PHH23_01775 [Paludibacteraceae bacterium]|nr:hypothetical protein [Paludibacteraceae bacterium]
MEEQVLEIVKNITAEREADGIEPTHSLLFDVINRCSTFHVSEDDCRKALRNLAIRNELVFGRTINDYYFKAN